MLGSNGTQLKSVQKLIQKLHVNYKKKGIFFLKISLKERKGKFALVGLLMTHTVWGWG